MTVLRRWIPYLSAFALLAAPSAAPAITQNDQTAQTGDVSATFAFQGSSPGFSHERLTIRRASTIAYDKAVSSAYCATRCAPGAPPTQLSVHVLDLESDGQPDVVLDLSTGGAHCCTVEQIFSLDASRGIYTTTERNFGDPGDEIRDLGHDGRLEFVSADDSFAYAFTDFAHSGLPLQILSFRGSRFSDVTRRYPGLLSSDAARWLRLFKHHLDNGVGFIAAWAADEDLLGHYALVKSTLAEQARRGNLRSAQSPKERSASKFVRALNRLLRTRRYVH